MSAFRDLTGCRFGIVLVLRQGEKINRNGRIINTWICQCDCGSIKCTRSTTLLAKTFRSCGCLREKRIGDLSRTHGKGKSLEYKSWGGMKERCLNENNTSYFLYGLRGITVCERWKNSFENFLEDMGEKPSKRHSIERIDVNGNYCKENCRWATPKEQANNRRSNRYIEYNDVVKTVSEWASYLNISYYKFWYHTNQGESMDSIFSRYKLKNPLQITVL